MLDTPPNLGLLTVNALVCADIILAPVSCEDEASVQGLVELRSTVSKLDRLRDRTPELLTLLTRWVPTRVLSQVIEQALGGLDLAPVVKVPARAAVGQPAPSTSLSRSARPTAASRWPTSSSCLG